MSLFTEKMKLLTAVILEEDKERVVKNLLSYGVVDFVNIDTLDAEEMKRIRQGGSLKDEEMLKDYRQRIENLFSQAEHKKPVLTKADLDNVNVLDIDRLRRLIERLSQATQSIKDRQRIVNQKYLSHQEMMGYLSEKKSEFINLQVGTVENRKEDFISRANQLGSVVAESKDNLVILYFKRDGQRVDELLSKFRWAETSEERAQKGSSDAVRAKLEALISQDKEALKALSDEVKEKISSKIEDLDKAWINVRVHELCGSVESYFSYTKNTVLLSGWIPSSSFHKVYDSIMDATDGRCILEERDAEDVEREKVPVSITSSRALKPFEHLVNNYGIPEYGSINPTPFASIAYIVMFALMFADLGQGFILLLVGILGASYYKKNPLKKDGLISRYLCSLLMFLGPASMIGGLLFGSCFGFSLIPALWFNYHSVVNGHGGNGYVNDIYDILGITIKFGIIIISLGLVLNWINLVRKKRYFTLIFDKNGLVGGLIYAIGIYVGFGFVSSGYRELSLPSWMAAILVFLIIMIFLSEPVNFIIKKRKGESEKISTLIINTVIESLITILEIFSGFLANTLSFMRVAGLGIAHVSLMTAFEDMAGMTGSPVFYVIIMILGNLLVTVLEGLSAGINSLRLNYYEFFTKFFTGHGFAYEPITLDGRKKVN